MMIEAELCRFLVENSPDALSHHSRDGVFLSASPACRGVFGCEPEELLDHALPDLLASEDGEELRTGWAAALQCERQTILRYRFPRAHGRIACIETRLRVVPAAPRGAPGSGETPGYVVCSSRDVSAQEEVERALAARLERAELAERHRDILVEMTPGLVWFGPVSPDLKKYHVTYMSAYLFEATGYSPRQWLETPGFWASIIHPADKARVLGATGAAMADGVPIPAYRLLARDGRVLWVQSFMRIERDAAGTPVRMYGLTLDVTIFKEAELERAAALERIRELSAPIIPVSDDVIVLPLIGAVDAARAEQVLVSLLSGVVAAKARIAIIDMTGVAMVDATSCATLMRAAGGVRMLGARVVLTGVQPGVAVTLVSLGLDGLTITTRSTLQSAIREFVTRPRGAAQR